MSAINTIGDASRQNPALVMGEQRRAAITRMKTLKRQARNLASKHEQEAVDAARKGERARAEEMRWLAEISRWENAR